MDGFDEFESLCEPARQARIFISAVEILCLLQCLSGFKVNTHYPFSDCIINVT